MQASQALTEWGVIKFDLAPLSGGIVNTSWRVMAPGGVFVLQKVNGIYKSWLMDDLLAVYSFLADNGIVVPQILPTKHGSLFVPDEEQFWRLTTFISGEVLDLVPSSQYAFAVGQALGKYHRVLSGLKYRFRHTRPEKDNIAKLHTELQRLSHDHCDARVTELLVNADDMLALNAYSHVRYAVTHGDPKISNFIFNANGSRECCLIDFDDCGRGQSVLYDLAKALRSWCGIHTLRPGCFNLDFFAAAIAGYHRVMGDAVQSDAIRYLPQEIQLRTLQTAYKFVLDCFRGSYFNWDREKFVSGQEFNIFHAQELLQLYRDLLLKESDVRKRVAEEFGCRAI